jgi:hypothetical protein
VLNIDIFRLQFVNAAENVSLEAIQPDEVRLNFFQGNDSSGWVPDVRQFKQVKYVGIYPGVDMEILGEHEHIKYNWLVAAGADLSQIKVQYKGETIACREGNSGTRFLPVSMREEKPIAYQEINGERKEVAVRFVLEGDEVHFEFPRDYDHSASFDH